MKNSLLSAISMSLFIGVFCVRLNAAPEYIRDYTGNFPAYPYNTSEYSESGVKVGCGPTTASMILAYFQHVHQLPSSSGLLYFPMSGEEEGLNTAKILHWAYFDTLPTGFSPQGRVEPAFEDYARDKGYKVKVTGHLPTFNKPDDPNLDYLGNYGDAWINNGSFWRRDRAGYLYIDKDLFCDFAAQKFSEGVTLFLAIDTNLDGGGDHWVPMVGFDRAAGQYLFHDTFDTHVHSADIHYCDAQGALRDNAISFVRTVKFLGRLDAIDHFQGDASDWVNPGDMIALPADLDEDGNYDTLAVIEPLSGAARIESPSPPEKACLFTAAPNGAEGFIALRFVDMTDSSYDPAEPANGPYVGVPFVSLDVQHGQEIRPGISIDQAGVLVNAFSDGNQTSVVPNEPLAPVLEGVYEFAHQEGVQEIIIATDYLENVLDNLILNSRRPAPRIHASPSTCNFGFVQEGQTSDPIEVVISNRGSRDLYISDISISGSRYFSLDLLGGEKPLGSAESVIRRGDRKTFTVVFAASRLLRDRIPTRAEVTILSNDPNTPEKVISLAGCKSEENPQAIDPIPGIRLPIRTINYIGK